MSEVCFSVLLTGAHHNIFIRVTSLYFSFSPFLERPSSLCTVFLHLASVCSWLCRLNFSNGHQQKAYKWERKWAQILPKLCIALLCWLVHSECEYPHLSCTWMLPLTQSVHSPGRDIWSIWISQGFQCKEQMQPFQFRPWWFVFFKKTLQKPPHKEKNPNSCASWEGALSTFTVN